MLRRFLNWRARAGGSRPAGKGRSRVSGCLLWLLLLIGLLLVVSLFSGSFRKGTRVTGMPSPFPVQASGHTGAYPAGTRSSHRTPVFPAGHRRACAAAAPRRPDPAAAQPGLPGVNAQWHTE